jgi:hypothetical protein
MRRLVALAIDAILLLLVVVWLTHVGLHGAWRELVHATHMVHTWIIARAPRVKGPVNG